MNKHTPGPWKYSKESGNDDPWWIVTTSSGNIVANVNSETGPDLPPLVSTKMPAADNAKLIAAAPDLLAALLLCEDVIGNARLQGKLSNNALSPVNDALVAARRAIDKTR